MIINYVHHNEIPTRHVAIRFVPPGLSTGQLIRDVLGTWLFVGLLVVGGGLVWQDEEMREEALSRAAGGQRCPERASRALRGRGRSCSCL